MEQRQRRQSSVLVFLLVMFAWVAVDGACSPVRAELSRQFREQLQRQYESGHIPDATRNMPYEQRLAIKKKQQMLAEEQRRQQAVQPPPARSQRDRDRRGERYENRREFGAHDPRYRYCEDRYRAGSREFNRCLRGDSREMFEDRRYRDRYDDQNFDRYDRYEERYYDGRPWRN